MIGRIEPYRCRECGSQFERLEFRPTHGPGCPVCGTDRVEARPVVTPPQVRTRTWAGPGDRAERPPRPSE